MAYLIAACAALGGFALAYALLARAFAPAGATRRRSASPLDDMRAERLVGAANRLLPQSKDAADRTLARLARAGLSCPPAVYHATAVALWAGAAVLVLLAALAFDLSLESELILAGIAAVAAFAAPRLYLLTRALNRAERMRAALPKALDLLATAVEAGLTLDRAIRLYSQYDSGPLSDELAAADREVNALGFARDDALARMADRCRVDDLSLFVGAVNSSAASGSPIADVLRAQADAAFERRRQHFEAEGNKLDAKMVLPLGVLLLPATLLAAGAPLLISVLAQASSSGVF